MTYEIDLCAIGQLNQLMRSPITINGVLIGLIPGSIEQSNWA